MTSGDLFLHGLFRTAHFHHSLLGCRCLFCCMEILGGKSKTQTMGWNINRLLGSLVFTVPDLHISSWLFLYSLYCISPRDCCFVTFCTIVLAGFVLHTVLKKIPHYSLPFFFFFSYLFLPVQIPYRGLSSSSSRFGCPWTLIVCLQPSAVCLLEGVIYVGVLQHLLMVTINATSPRKSHMNNYEHPKFIWGAVINNCKIWGKMALSVYESNTNQRFVTSLIKTRWSCLCNHICKLHSVLDFMFPPPNWMVLWIAPNQSAVL